MSLNLSSFLKQNKKISENLEELIIADQSEHLDEGDSANQLAGTRISKSQKRKV